MTGKEILFQILLLQVSVWQLLEAPSPSPLPIKALEGSCVAIPCTFRNSEPHTNTEDLGIKWFRNPGARAVYPYGNPSGGRVEFVGDLKSGNCSLQINNVRKEDASNEYYPWITPVTEAYVYYTVQVSDKPEELSLSVPGEMTEGTPVNITCSAVYTCPPKGIEVIGETSPVEGTSVILTCTFKSSNPGVTNYTWYRNGNPLHGTASKMQFNHVTSNFSGIYKCMVHNNLGNSSSSPVTVTVLYPPKGTHVNASLNNPKAGDTLILKCETTSSNPGVEGYSWYKDESHLQNQSEETLTIANLEPSHSGSYRCEARNAAGRSFSPNATLDIGVSGTPLDSKSFATLGGTTAFLLLLLLALFILLWISWKRKKEEKAQKTPTERIPEDIVYVSIDHSKQRRTQRRSVPSDDFVTYAAVKRNTENEQPGPISDVAYAQVKKTRRPPKKEDEVIYATDVKFTPRTPNGQESQSVADDFVEYAAVKR